MTQTFGCQLEPDGKGVRVRGGISTEDYLGDIDGIIRPGQKFYNVEYVDLEQASKGVGSITVTIDD
jgi:hypothetical protein